MAVASGLEGSAFPGVFFEAETGVSAPPAVADRDRGGKAGGTGAAGKPVPGRGIRRFGRLLVALGLLGAGAYAALDDQLSLTTDHAVVSPNAVKLRSPNAGTD